MITWITMMAGLLTRVHRATGRLDQGDLIRVTGQTCCAALAAGLVDARQISIQTEPLHGSCLLFGGATTTKRRGAGVIEAALLLP